MTLLGLWNLDMDSPSRSLNPIKLLKEEFVSNLNKSSMIEIAVLSTTVPGLMLLRHIVSSYATNDLKSKISVKKDYNVVVPSEKWMSFMAKLIVDFIFICLPMILFFHCISKLVINMHNLSDDVDLLCCI